LNTLLTLHDPATARRYYEDGVWTSDTFYSLVVDNAARNPDGFALRDAHRRLTWSEVLAWTDAFAADLHEAGVHVGERVSIWLPNCVESVIVLLACSRIGAICNPSLHQNYTVDEILKLLQRLDTRAFIAQPGYGADAAAVDVFEKTRELASLAITYRLGAVPEGSGNATRQGFPELTSASSPRADDPDRIMYLAFTSGTTGEPKGVLHSANSLLTNMRAMVKDWHHNERTILLSLSPMSHHIGVVAVGQALVAGCELVVNDLPDGLSTYDWIEKTGATYCMGVPTHAIDVQAEMTRRGLSQLAGVSVFYMAGAPIPPETAQRFLDMNVTPQNIYGMTENSSHQYTLPTDSVETIISTCGRACDGFEVKLFSETDRDAEVAQGEIGEIGSRGGCLMLGYFDNQTATEQSFNRDGWFMSGDLGRFDENGCLEIRGRIKDLIIRGGHNIHPSRIEALSMRHADVNKAAAVAVADERLGEKVCLALVGQAGCQLDPDQMLAHLHESGLSKYDMPEYFLQVDEFPLTASGKILKRELSRQIADGEQSLTPIRWIEPKS